MPPGVLDCIPCLDEPRDGRCPHLGRDCPVNGHLGRGDHRPCALHLPGGDSVTGTVGDTENGFYVADDAPGVSPDKRECVFETGYSTREAGTGLGLNIVQEIADAHGWAVRVTESLEDGTSFEITEARLPTSGPLIARAVPLHQWRMFLSSQNHKRGP